MSEVFLDNVWIPYDTMTAKRTKRLDKKYKYLGSTKIHRIGSKTLKEETDQFFYNHKAVEEPDE